MAAATDAPHGEVRSAVRAGAGRWPTPPSPAWRRRSTPPGSGRRARLLRLALWLPLALRASVPAAAHPPPAGELVKGTWDFGKQWFTPTEGSHCVASGSCLEKGEGFAALAEGVAYRKFDPKEAQKCLRAKTGSGRVIVAGDSFMRRLFIGLQDVLRGDTSNAEDGRDDAMRKSGSVKRVVKGVNMVYLLHFGVNEKGLAAAKLNKRDVVVYGSMTHDHKFRKVDELIGKDKTLSSKERKDLLRSPKKHPGRAKYRQLAHKVWLKRLPKLKAVASAARSFVWVTQPHYYMTKLSKTNPDAAQNQNNARYWRFARRGLDVLRPRALLDTYHLSQACARDNCTRDGAHYAWFVNRMKAQVLLNQLCPAAGVV